MQPLCHAGPVGRDRLGDRAGVAGPIFRLGRQAVPRQRHQLAVSPAGVKPGEGVGQVAAAGLVEGSVGVAPDVGRGPGQDLAEHCPEAEDVGPLVEQLNLAEGLLGGHVGGRPQHRTGP